MMVISQSKITTRGQITVPVKILKRLRLSPGDKIVFEEKDGEIVLTKTSEPVSALDLHKYFQDKPKKSVSLDEIRRAREQSYTEKI